VIFKGNWRAKSREQARSGDRVNGASVPLDFLRRPGVQDAHMTVERIQFCATCRECAAE
jgi:hypothetical protein